MTLSYAVTKDFKVTIKSGSKVIDEVGPWDSVEGAELWGAAVCEKYNSADYAGVDYPNEKPKDDPTA